MTTYEFVYSTPAVTNWLRFVRHPHNLHHNMGINANSDGHTFNRSCVVETSLSSALVR